MKPCDSFTPRSISSTSVRTWRVFVRAGDDEGVDHAEELGHRRAPPCRGPAWRRPTRRRSPRPAGAGRARPPWRQWSTPGSPPCSRRRRRGWSTPAIAQRRRERRASFSSARRSARRWHLGGNARPRGALRQLRPPGRHGAHSGHSVQTAAANATDDRLGHHALDRPARRQERHGPPSSRPAPAGPSTHSARQPGGTAGVGVGRPGHDGQRDQALQVLVAVPGPELGHQVGPTTR